MDSLRGTAIVMMIVFHFLYDLNYFAGKSFVLTSGFWLVFARITASIFLLLVGISLTLSFSRAKENKTKKQLLGRYLKRGVKIFSWGLLITLITFIFLREGFVIFGILHLIGISIILAYPLLKHKYLNLLLGAVFITAGLFLRNFTFDFKWLLWLGFTPRELYSFDYFPVLPWFGLVLVGIFIGNALYMNSRRGFRIPDLSGFPAVKSLAFLGRRSLLIYLLHEPAIVIVLYLSGAMPAGALLG